MLLPASKLRWRMFTRKQIKVAVLQLYKVQDIFADSKISVDYRGQKAYYWFCPWLRMHFKCPDRATHKRIYEMSKVVAITSSKGGIGKSMTAVNIAIDASNRGLSTLLVDAEKDGTTIDFEARESELLTVLNGYDKSFPKMIDIYRNNYDLIVIDTAGVNADIDGDNENLQELINDKIIAKSDFLLIPIEPSPVTIRKSLRFFNCVEKYLDHARGNLDALVYINKAAKNTIYTRELAKDLPGAISIPVSKNQVSDLTAFKKAEEQLQSVNEFDPKSDAALQMRLLQKEVFQKLGLEWSK